MNYNEKLDELFDKWINSLNAEQKSLFCKDGLIYKFGESENDINEKWEKAERRIVFLLKDKNPMEGDDIRKWLIEGKYAENNRDLSGGIISKSGLLPNIALMFYGLLTTQKNVRFGFDECESKMEEVRQTWNTEPFALIEAKKEAGSSSSLPSDISQALARDRNFLIEELNILQPTVIVCCDRTDTQFNFITQQYLKNEAPKIKIEYPYSYNKPMNCRLWHYSTKGITVIKSFHPSNRGKEKWMIYERVISPFHKLLKKI